MPDPSDPFVVSASPLFRLAPGGAGLRRLMLRAFGHVLEQNPQARDRLRPHRGKQVLVRGHGLRMALQIGADGSLGPGESDPAVRAPDLSLDIDMAAMLGARLRGVDPATGVRIAGDAEFAQVMSWLLDHVRWDAEQDLSGFIGDIAAHRLARAARAVAADARRWPRQVQGDMREWFAEAPRALVTREELGAAAAEVARQRDAVARLDKRVQALARRVGGG